MVEFYFILNPSECTLIKAESEQIAKDVFDQFSINKKYQYIITTKPVKSQLLEMIIQRETINKI